jgi:hypothetical protein
MYTIKLKDWFGFELTSIDIPDSEFNNGQPITQVELEDWAKQAYNKFKKTVVILKDGKQVASYSMLNEG